MMRLYERIVGGYKEGLLASLARAFLALLALFYLIAYYSRCLVYRLHLVKRRRLDAPVVSVGNLTLGGTGKTPFVMMLADELRRRDVKVAVLARGYGATISGVANDETLMFLTEAPDVPLYTSSNRFRAGLEALKDGAELLILDDGFQHWRLERDLDILLIDGINPFGYGFIFPRGLLREPVGAMKRADVVVLTHSDVPVERLKRVIEQTIKSRSPEGFFCEAVHRPKELIRLDKKEKAKKASFIKDKNVLAFCGLGNPHSFFISLAQLGARIKAFHSLPDHFKYKARIVSALETHAKKLNCDFMVTTAKDAVKLEHFDFEVPLYVLTIEMEMKTGKDELFAKVEELLDEKRTQEEK